jgi:uncharacterized protein (DUF58 family)
MLSPEIISRIKRIHIKSSRVVNTPMAGQYKSAFRGTGMEFEEVREYAPGDEVRDIDWKVSARMGRPFIKRYREEREVVVMLLVDMSGSTLFGTQTGVKRDTASEVASILAFNAIRNNDKVGAILFTDDVEQYIPPKKGSSHVWRVIKSFYDFKPHRTGTDIGGAVAYLGRVTRKKTVTFLISDFISPGPGEKDTRQLRMAGKKHDLIAVVLSDPGDFKLPMGGIVTARDLESGHHLMIDAFDPKIRKTFEERQTSAYRQRIAQLRASDVDIIEVSTNGSVADALTRFFRSRRKRF